MFQPEKQRNKKKISNPTKAENGVLREAMM